MNWKYWLLTGIAVVLGIGMLFIPEKDVDKQGQPERLLAAMQYPGRFVSPDEITDRLLRKDSSLVLIDLRPESQFRAFAIPGAINIPVDSLLSDSAQDILSQDEMDKVCYSNADATADQAWIICQRLNLPQIYVLEGGINEWFNVLVKTEKPVETAPVEAQELYQFRMAARKYFFGVTETKAEIEIPKAPIASKKVIKKIREKPNNSGEEGC